MVIVWSLSKIGMNITHPISSVQLSLVFQIPYEDRCLDPETPPQKFFFGFLSHLLRR